MTPDKRRRAERMSERYLVPLVGTELDPGAPEQVLQAYEDVEQALRLLYEAKRHLTEMLVEHSMTSGRRTVTVPGGARYERTGGPRKGVHQPVRPGAEAAGRRDARGPGARDRAGHHRPQGERHAGERGGPRQPRVRADHLRARRNDGRAVEDLSEMTDRDPPEDAAFLAHTRSADPENDPKVKAAFARLRQVARAEAGS